MPSYRYTRDISQDDLNENNQKQYTDKEKLNNFLYYHKWHLIGGGVLIAVVLAFVISIFTATKTDFIVGLITTKNLPYEYTEYLEKNLSQYAYDVNGDNKLRVSIKHYYINPDDFNATAGLIGLQADIGRGDSVLFIIDDAVAFQKDSGFFAYANDPYKNFTQNDTDYENLSIPLKDTTFYKNLPDETYSDFEENKSSIKEDFADYGICIRMITDSNLAEDEKFAEYFKENLNLLNNLK